MFGGNEAVDRVSRPTLVFYFWERRALDWLEGTPAIRSQDLCKLALSGGGLRQCVRSGCVCFFAGIMAQQDFRFVGHAIAIAVFVGDTLQSGGDIRFGRSSNFGDKPESITKRVMRKLVEVFGRFVLARQMTGCAAAQAFAEEAVVMLIES